MRLSHINVIIISNITVNIITFLIVFIIKQRWQSSDDYFEWSASDTIFNIIPVNIICIICITTSFITFVIHSIRATMSTLNAASKPDLRITGSPGGKMWVIAIIIIIIIIIIMTMIIIITGSPGGKMWFSQFWLQSWFFQSPFQSSPWSSW